MESLYAAGAEPVVSVEAYAGPAEMLFDLPAKSNAELLTLGLDATMAEDSRIEAINLLSERRAAPALEQLIGLLTDSETSGEMRRTVLKAIANNRIDKALPTLQWLYHHIPVEQDGLAWVFAGYNREALLRARGKLGDTTALRDLICRDYLGGPPAYPLKQTIEQFGGLASVVAGLSSSLAVAAGSVEQQLRHLAQHDEAMQMRRWAIDRLAERAEQPPVDFYLERLGDAADIVAAGASDILVQLSVQAIAPLSQTARNGVLADEQRLWAVYTLLRQRLKVEELLAEIPRSQIPLPTPISQELRQAIVREWAGYPTSLIGKITASDIRWLIEKAQLPEPPAYAAAAWIAQLRAALQTVGLQTHAAIDCGAFYGSGGGTYWLLPIATAEANIERYLYISRLGPFVSYAIHAITRDESGQGRAIHWQQLAAIDPTGLWQAQALVCRQIAEGMGFTWVDETILAISVPSLCDPYPYEPDEMRVHSLLYYWMD